MDLTEDDLALLIKALKFYNNYLNGSSRFHEDECNDLIAELKAYNCHHGMEED
jgi:hypothetical protein